MDASRKSDFVGQRLLHYQVAERLGAGGLGVVCRAIDMKLKRTVALKFLPVSLSEREEVWQRFVIEMRACAVVEHPNIGALHALEEAGDGRMFLVMAFYEGPTLAKRLESGPIPFDESVSIALQMLRGLEQAHAHGVIHGDLKPANLIFNALGVVKILDFGLAKFHETPELGPGSVPGTPAYMSPEHGAGSPADRRSDLWSAGVVLYEMLTGQRLFLGANPPSVLATVLSSQPASVAGLPPGLDQIVKKALEKDPERRYQGASEMIRDLETVQRSRQRSTSPEEDEMPAPAIGESPLLSRQWAQTEQPGQGRGWIIAAVAAVLLAVGGFAAWYHLRRPAPMPGVPLALGRVRLLQERYPEAVAQFERVLSIDPQNEDAYRGLAQAYAAMGLTDKAVEAWQSDIALHPDSVDAYDQLGKFELNRRDYAAAIANFRSALKLAPDDPSILSDLGAALAHAGSLAESRSALEKSVRLEPSDSAWNNLGDLDLKQRHFPAAAADYAKALEFNNTDYRVWTNLALAYARAPGQKEKAKDAFQHAARMCREALKSHPNDPVILSDLAVILASGSEEHPEALASIKRALSLAPDDTHVRFNAAQTYAALGRRSIALGWIEKLVAGGYPIQDIDASPILADLVKNRRDLR